MGLSTDRAGIDIDRKGIRTQEALLNLISATGKILPSVLFVNDIHWADQRSEAVLRDLVTQVGLRGVLIVCAFRSGYLPSWSDHPSVREIQLKPLAAQAAEKLYRSRAAESDADITKIVRLSGGNPLFIEELAARAVSASTTSGTANRSSIPSSLSGLLLERVDELSAPAQTLLRTASVIGRRFNAKVAMVTGPKANAALIELSASGLVTSSSDSPDEFIFKHALVRDAIYDGLLRHDRRILHAKVAHRLEDSSAGNLTDIAEELARHFEIAEEPLVAARYAFMAGEKALDLFALSDADHWFKRCLELFPDDLDSKDELLRMQAVSNQIQILCWDARFDDMVELADRELGRVRALGKTPMVSTVLSWLGEAYLHDGRFEESKEVLDEALTIAENYGESTVVGHALAELVWLNSITGTPGERAEHDALIARILHPAADAGRTNFQRTFAIYAGWVNACHGGYMAEARKVAQDLISFGKIAEYPPAQCWGDCLAAHVEAQSGNSEEALRYCDRAKTTAACAFDQLAVHLCRGVVLQALDRTVEALAAFDAAGRNDLNVGMFFFGNASISARGSALIGSGKVKAGKALLQSATKKFQEIGLLRGAAMAQSALGEALFRLPGRAGDANDALMAADELAAQTGMLGLLAGVKSVRGLIALEAGNRDAASDLFDQAKAAVAPLNWLALEQKINVAVSRLGSHSNWRHP